MSITIVRSGLLTTVQDMGRHGVENAGVGPGGAMDDVAHRIANALVGNAWDAAALETTLTGTAFRCDDDTLLAVTGGVAPVTIDGHAAPMHRAIAVRAGSVLDVGRCTSGCRSSIAFAGGIDVPVVLASRSTHLRGAFGGFGGRAVKGGDHLPIGAVTDEGERLLHALMAGAPAWSAERARVHDSIAAAYVADQTVRVIRGAQYALLDDASLRAFEGTPYRVDAQSDRMGCRLNGAALRFTAPIEMTSEAVAWGTIQLPPDGQPLVLLADRQTTGGYPVVGYVASVDRAALSQRCPGDEIAFHCIEHAVAQRLLLDRERALIATLHALSLQRAGRR